MEGHKTPETSKVEPLRIEPLNIFKTKLNLGHMQGARSVLETQFSKMGRGLDDSPMSAMTQEEVVSLIKPAAKYEIAKTPEEKAALEEEIRRVADAIWQRDEEIGVRQATEGILRKAA